MTHQELRDYLIPACKKVIKDYSPYVSVVDAEELDRLLGLKTYHDYCLNDGRKPLPEEVRQLYIKLAGPHGRTILKAWRILKGLDR